MHTLTQNTTQKILVKVSEGDTCKALVLLYHAKESSVNTPNLQNPSLA